jgi:hypothetical protein
LRFCLLSPVAKAKVWPDLEWFRRLGYPGKRHQLYGRGLRARQI